MYGRPYGTTSYGDRGGGIISYILTASTGAFALTGGSTIFTKSLHLIAHSGTFILTGVDIVIYKSYLLTAEVSTFILTGVDTLLHKGYNIIAGAGTFSLVGIALTFKVILGSIFKPISYLRKNIPASSVNKVRIISKIIKDNIISKFI